jgi:3-hydroxyisobutyrate dehydrogenase
LTRTDSNHGNTSSPKLGWIGIGRMGYAMAERLAKAAPTSPSGTARAPRPNRWQRWREDRRSPADLAACDIVFVMVSTWDDVKEVVSGPGGC